jgi:diguanylate cyclase (GGDEF)-like protein/PAS domain S-box-containing protein
MILELIKGVALLLALSLLQGFIARFPHRDEALARIVSGGLFGGICVIGMMLPIEVGSGVIFDPRSVVLSMAGLFGGPAVGLVSATIAGGYRAWLGGGGLFVGLAVIVACTALGLAYRYAYQRGWLKINLLNLLLFGLVVHLVEVALFTQLPHAIVETVMSAVAVPLVLTFTPATALLGLLLKDIENRTQVASALLASEASLSLHLENTPLAAISWDENFRCTRWNKAAAKIFGYTSEEALGKHPRELLIPSLEEEDLDSTFNLLMTELAGSRRVKENKTKDGRQITCEWFNTPIVDEDGNTVGVFSLGEDITARKESERLIWRQANFDTLTGLANRQMLRHRLQQEIKIANRSKRSVALLYLDLDQFKEVNDTLGHHMGDALLVEVAERLSRYVREIDTVARLGGDEFTIVMGRLSDFDSVERVANDILTELAVPFQLTEKPAYISTSIGISLYPQDSADADGMLKNADQAMYAAKNKGRNCFEFFTSSMQEDSLVRMSIVNDLRVALSGRQFRLHFQPIVELANGSVHKAEALIRWQHPTRGLVSPSEFIRVAEETRMIAEIDDWVFREAVRQSARWRASHDADFQVTVNTSPLQYERADIDISGWLEHLHAVGLPGAGIAVEITEGRLMETSSEIRDKLLMFRDANIQVSLDDFGTGYSSLSYLRRFDIDYLKIDQSFVQDLQPGNEDMVLCEAIIAMAHKLGLKVIAEGIETQHQCDLLRDAGCDYGQGFHFSKALPADDFQRRVFGA